MTAAPAPAAATPARAEAPSSSRAPRLLQRRCAACATAHAEDDCETCRRNRLQRRTAIGAGLADDRRLGDALTGRVTRMLGRTGQPLDATLRRHMESRFATSFADVRIHADSESGDVAKRVGAEAFTLGQNIAFAPGRYDPAREDGVRLVAHELAHTVQQRALPSSRGGAIEVDAPDTAFEREADRAAAQVMAGTPTSVRARGPAPGLQRKASADVEEINDLLSYGLFDWAITDADALKALTRLKGLPPVEQAEFLSDRKFAGRLREQLPPGHVAELDAIEAAVKALLPAETTVDAIIDRLSYGLFDWAITDKDAVEALELLKTLKGEQLAIALKRIDVGRLMDNLPDTRRPELTALVDAGIGPGGTFDKAAAQSPGVNLRSLDFVSDHSVVRKNDTDWTRSGDAFPQPDWALSEKGETRGDTISHTKGQPIVIKLGLDVAPASLPAQSAVLTGKGSASFLDFRSTAPLGGGRGKQLAMVSPNKLPDSVAAYRDQSIEWTIDWGAGSRALGPTQPFDIFTTIDRPKNPSEVTTRRLGKAVELVGSAPSLAPHDVVRSIMKNWTNFNLDVRYANEWDLADDIKTGAQCIDLVRFVQSVIGTVGLPGQADAVVIWALPTDAMTAIESPWRMGGMSMAGPHPGEPTWRTALLDGNFRPNNFEAALKFTADGSTKYYPGGVDDVMDTPNQVLRVFNCLAWYKIAGPDRYEIMEVPGAYSSECKVGASHSFSGN